MYNTTTHSTTKLKPIEIFFGIKEGEERPLNLQRILDNRNEVFDDVIEQLKTRQEKQIEYHNKSREDDPHFEPQDPIFVKTVGIPNKKKKKFKKQEVKTNRRKTVIDNRNIRLHKENIKRKRKT